MISKRGYRVRAKLKLPGDEVMERAAMLAAALSHKPLRIENPAGGSWNRNLREMLQKMGIVFADDTPGILMASGELHPDENACLTPASPGELCLVLGLTAGYRAAIKTTPGEAGPDNWKRLWKALEAFNCLGHSAEGDLWHMENSLLHAATINIQNWTFEEKWALVLAGVRAQGQSTLCWKESDTFDHLERLLLYGGLKINLSSRQPEAVGDELERRIRLAQKKSGVVEASEVVLRLEGGAVFKAEACELAGDPALASLWVLGATLHPGSAVEISGVSLNSSRTGAVQFLRRMGANVVIDCEDEAQSERRGTIKALPARMEGRKQDFTGYAGRLEEMALCALAGAYAKGETVLRGAQSLRQGSIDRLALCVNNLRAMGVKVGELEDGMVIQGSSEGYQPTEFESGGDAWLGITFALASMINTGQIMVNHLQPAKERYPHILERLEASFEKSKKIRIDLLPP